jgi:cytochrome c biogenesis protein CcmG/thiol:disulfide interchange protein DsbE
VLLLVMVAVGLVALFVPIGRAPDGIVIRGSPLLGKPAPPVDLVDLDGARVRLADHVGRPVVVHFWATWCIPCREEFRLFADARREHASDGLEILGIVHDDTAEAAGGFARSQGADWPILPDPDETAWNAWLGAGLPTTYFVDRDGIVRDFSLGPVTSGGLRAQLAKILVPMGSPGIASPGG